MTQRARWHSGMWCRPPREAQVAQRRWGTAALHAATVAVYLAGAFAVGGDRAVWLALAWNMWSVVDAYWYERN